MTMTCLSKDEIIDYLFSEDLSARADMEAHFTACPGCRAKKETLKQLKAAASSLEPEPVSGDFMSRLMRSLPAEVPSAGTGYLRSFYKSVFSPTWVFGLAAFAVVLYLGVFALTGPRAPRDNIAEALCFSDGPATVNREFPALGEPAGKKKAGYSYTDVCATARCGIL
jgi:anti-sigma factor RsiW